MMSNVTSKLSHTKVCRCVTGPVEIVWLLQLWLDQFFNEIQFFIKQVIDKSASVIFALVRLIALSYNR